MDKLENRKIAFIGVGHMAQALLLGLVDSNVIGGKNTILSNPNIEKIKKFSTRYGSVLKSSNKEAAENADIIFLTVRPRVIQQVIKEIRDSLKKDALIISVASGVTIPLLKNYFKDPEIKIMRIMPNIPVTYGIGIIGSLFTKEVTKTDKVILKKLLSPLGMLIECKNDDQINKLSMISGSGPGYVGYFMDSLEQIAKNYGFSEDDSHRMISQTFKGTLKHLESTGISTNELVKSVATKGGITEEVISSLDTSHFPDLFKESISKGHDKIENITNELIKESKTYGND